MNDTKQRITTLVSQFVREYNDYCRASRNSYMATLKPGTPTPKEGVIYGEINLANFKASAANIRGKVDEIIDARLKDVLDKKTAAPTTDATNTLMLFTSRSHVSKKDIEEMLEAYGDNYQCFCTIKDIGKKNKIYIGEHPLTATEEDLTHAKSNLDSYITYEGIMSRGEGFGEFILANMPDDI